MLRQFIKFSSITHAQKAMDILYKNGISSKMGRNPFSGGKSGCGFVLYVNGDINRAFGLITEAGIKNSGLEAGDVK